MGDEFETEWIYLRLESAADGVVSVGFISCRRETETGDAAGKRKAPARRGWSVRRRRMAPQRARASDGGPYARGADAAASRDEREGGTPPLRHARQREVALQTIRLQKMNTGDCLVLVP